MGRVFRGRGIGTVSVIEEIYGDSVLFVHLVVVAVEQSLSLTGVSFLW